MSELMLETASEGDVITMKEGPMERVVEHPVLPRCFYDHGRHASGYSDAKGRHLRVWICYHHGPEVP